MRTSTWYRPTSWGPLDRLVVGMLLAVALGITGWWAWARLSDQSCAEGVTERAGECVGVTDGGYSFSPLLDHVSRRIAEENAEVLRLSEDPEEPRDYVTIAFMVPMDPATEAEREQTLREVQGAYLAQYRANHHLDETPLIRLVLANPGRNNAHWEPVAEQLAGMAGSASNLRAVTGFNMSIDSTEDTIRYLTREHGIPVVAGPLTADSIGNTDAHPDAFPGMAKIVPNNGDQARALGHFNEAIPGYDPARTLLVADERDGDPYVDTLADVFGELTRQAAYAPETFTSPEDVNDEGTLANYFSQMVSTICQGDTETIYFAGRPVQLRQFVNALGQRHCTGRAYTVITGSGASSLANDDALDWGALSNGVTVRYSSIVHPAAWASGNPPAPRGGSGAFDELVELVAAAGSEPVGPIGPGEGSSVDLTDSRTITIYDAVSTAVEMIRLMVTGEQPIPTLADIGNSWQLLRGENKVTGASGWICLDNNHNAFNKAVSVVSLDPEREGEIRFDGVAWPEGRAPTDCRIPQ